MPFVVVKQPGGNNIQIGTKNLKQNIYLKRKEKLDSKISIYIPDMWTKIRWFIFISFW